jgi:lipopolysaccharide cholinephosphotransferase
MIDGTLKKLQAIELEILDEYIRICDKFNLTYFLTGGSALGAFRHKGFIPWDDDIDIGMPRDDYEKFLILADSELKVDYYIWNVQKYSDTNFCFTKICKINTVFLENDTVLEEGKQGIFIDFFPYDNAVNCKLLLFLQDLFYQTYTALYHYKINRTKKGIKAMIFRFVTDRLSFKTIQSLRQKPMLIFKNRKTDYFVQWTGTFSYKRETFNKSMFFPLEKIEFEGKLYNCPHDMDAYLTQMYGDYMRLPPEDQRVSHNPKLIIFDTTQKI